MTKHTDPKRGQQQPYAALAELAAWGLIALGSGACVGVVMAVVGYFVGGVWA